MKDDYISWAEECLEFDNGSYIMGVDLASDSKIARGERSKIVWVDSRYMKQENRKWVREQIKEMKLNWYQKLRIELSFVLDDIKEWMSWGIVKRGVHK